VLTPQLINQESAAPQPAVAEQAPNEARTYFVAQDGTRWELLKKPAVESRLNNYLVNHQERSPSINMKGIMPYATFVSYDENKQ
jgi:sigma-E factor negative regulatory protein RseA